MLGVLDQLHNRGIELVVAGAEAEQRRDGQFALADRTGRDAVAAFCKYPAKPDDRAAQCTRVWSPLAVHRIDGGVRLQDPRHQRGHAIGDLATLDQMVAIEAIAISAIQVHVVDAGAAVEQGVVDDEAFQVHHPQPLPGLHGNAVDRHTSTVAASHFEVQRGIAGTGRLADQASLGAVPIDEDGDLQLRSRRLGSIERREHLPTAVVVLQIECGDQNSLLRAGNPFEQRGAELAGTAQAEDAPARNRNRGQTVQSRRRFAAATQTLDGRRQGRGHRTVHAGVGFTDANYTGRPPALPRNRTSSSTPLTLIALPAVVAPRRQKCSCPKKDQTTY